MLNYKLDILNLEWPNSDRDLHIVIPSLVYLSKKYNLKIETKSIFSAYWYLLKYRPKILILSNFVGAGINFNVAKIARRMNIKVISLISEGNFKENEIELYLHGKNKINDKAEIVVDKYLLWNKKSKQLILDKYKDIENILSVTGATGFDRYLLLKNETKKDFLTKNNLKFKNIIGIAGWAFGIMFNSDKEYYIDTYGESQVLMHQEDLLKINKIYRELILKNTNTLFILRYHPATINLKEDEFLNLEKYDNVFISDVTRNSEYQISDLINISDLWIGYETTTALESWLLNKQTFLINPTREDFTRENVHKGSPIVKTTEEAQTLIDEFFMKGSIHSFEKLKPFRNDIIKDVIEYGDGKNHIRAAYEVMKVFNEPNIEIKFSFEIYRESIKQILKLILSKTIMKKKWPELNYKKNFAITYQDMYKKVI